MFNRIKSLFGEGAHSVPQRGTEGKLLAAAALMVEAACMDGEFAEAERKRIFWLLRQRFGLSADEAETLISEAEAAQSKANQLLGFTRAVKDGFDHDERVALVELLWEVAYADGDLHPYEANLLRRVSGLIYVSDQESGAARKRVLARLRPAAGARPDPA